MHALGVEVPFCTVVLHGQLNQRVELPNVYAVWGKTTRSRLDDCVGVQNDIDLHEYEVVQVSQATHLRHSGVWNSHAKALTQYMTGNQKRKARFKLVLLVCVRDGDRDRHQ
jgi:hypothetical protein